MFGITGKKYCTQISADSDGKNLCPSVKRNIFQRFFYNKRAQSVLEYAVLIGVIAAALLTMQQYMRRSIDARVKRVGMELNEAAR